MYIKEILEGKSNVAMWLYIHSCLLTFQVDSYVFYFYFVRIHAVYICVS